MSNRPQLQEVDGIGQRIRRARRELGLTQAEVADPLFTKSYISALERNRARPSLKALQHIADRLALRIPDLLAAENPAFTTVDAPARTQDLDSCLDEAEWLIATARADVAKTKMRLLVATSAAGPDGFGLPGNYRYFYLSALAHAHDGELHTALEQVERAIVVAQQLGDAPAELVGARNLLGWIYAAQGAHSVALHHHEFCRTIIEQRQLRALNLRLSVYKNLAHDHQALGKSAQARALRQHTLQLARENAGLDEQSAIYWDLAADAGSITAHACGSRLSSQALGLQEVISNRAIMVQILFDQADAAIAQGDITAANRILTEVAPLITDRDRWGQLCSFHEYKARLGLLQAQLETAAAHARQALDQCILASTRNANCDRYHRLLLQRAHARSLHTAALVAEARHLQHETTAHLDSAIALLAGGDQLDLLYELEFTYAEILRARGEHQAAGDHYRRAHNYYRVP